MLQRLVLVAPHAAVRRSTISDEYRKKLEGLSADERQLVIDDIKRRLLEQRDEAYFDIDLDTGKQQHQQQNGGGGGGANDTRLNSILTKFWLMAPLAFVLATLGSSAAKAFKEHQWPTAPATIVDRSESHFYRDDTNLSADAIVYQYTLWGKSFEHAQDPSAIDRWCGAGTARSQPQYATAGTHVTVHFNPRSPSWSVLDPPMLRLWPMWGIDKSKIGREIPAHDEQQHEHHASTTTPPSPTSSSTTTTH